jgi:hypothetical protein
MIMMLFGSKNFRKVLFDIYLTQAFNPDCLCDDFNPYMSHLMKQYHPYYITEVK